MTLTQVWGALVIFIGCPLLGGLPLIQWITFALTGQQLTQQGTRNISVSAAFYHGGKTAGILAVASEALKGIAAVLIARYFFPFDPVWEIIALMALVLGRYWIGKGAGTTNVVWGYLVHDPAIAGLVFLIGGISFTLLRERKQAKFGVLVLLALLTALLYPQSPDLIGASVLLAGLLGWIYTQIPDDLDMDTRNARPESRSMFRFFRGDRAIRTLDQPLDTQKFGEKASTLARLKQSGFPIPSGWALAPGDDPQLLIDSLEPSPQHPFIVRSSAVGEDSETASAAGQYESILSITSREALLPAISRCFASYHQPAAVQYRRDRDLPESTMAVLIQQQIRGVFSGVAFSRDPITRQGNAVLIEALPGNASQVVSGRVTPETYQVFVDQQISSAPTASDRSAWVLPDDLILPLEGTGDVPPRLIQQVAYLARHLETYFEGVPQDIEWSFDGQTLWLLQSRPITTLLPLWTRKIAAEVIPGLIRPLTWSINRPLTCGVWGDLFTLVLGDRGGDLDFTQTATLHYSRAYFNASLLGQTFRRMGLPAESLEFLTRGAKFSQPSLRATLQNVPGLLRLAGRELSLVNDFQQSYRQRLAPAIAEFTQQPALELSAIALLTRIRTLLELLKIATYYSILAPLSAALRKAIFKVNDENLDNSATPEVAALRSLQDLARDTQPLLDPGDRSPALSSKAVPDLLTTLAATAAGQKILERLAQIIDQYGYLSQVGTDIAVPTWREQPQAVRDLFVQFCFNPPELGASASQAQGSQKSQVQRRFDLKGQVTETYSRLLAELRWSFVALEAQWLELGWLQAAGDIFFLEFDEVQLLIERGRESLGCNLADLIAQRKSHLEGDRQLETVPFLVYGIDPPVPLLSQNRVFSQQLQGIGASPGLVEGRIRVIHNLDNLPDISRDTILVVPYTDSGWAPLLARAGGLIAEVGGRLSHGAIVAREYRIPAVMDIQDATQLLQDGQLVRIDGQAGTVAIL